jgi:hypothetical protein
MVQDTELPAHVARCLDALVDSLECLEVMLLLYRGSDRTWSPNQVTAELGIPARAARRELEQLRSRGLVSADDGEYRYAPRPGAPVADVECVVEAYGSRRIAIINHVASGALKRIQSLAEAFRLKKDDDHE